MMAPACPADHNALAWWSTRVCWYGMVAVWIIGALYNKANSPKVQRRQLMAWRFVIPVVVWLLIVRMPGRMWVPLTFCDLWVRMLGLALLYVGSAFTLWARFALGAMWTGAPSQRAGHELRTTGPYAIVRHPIYTGLLAMLLGTTLIYHVGLFGPFFVVMVIVLVIKLRIEEQLMRETFGATYDDYRARVPALVPLIGRH